MNLVHFLALLVKYKLSFEYFRPGVIAEIKETLNDAGSVWLKFAQALSQMKDFVSDDLALALEPLWYDCKIHDHAISKHIIARELGGDYDTTSMKFLGSGSMAQTYKVFCAPTKTWVCMKVMHPGAPEEIHDAIRVYDAVKDSFLFPSQFKNISWMFFESLKTQVDFKSEYEMGMKMWETYQTTNLWYDGYRGRPVVVVPKPIHHTPSCLVMECEESFHIVWSNIDEVCAKYNPTTVMFALRVADMFLPYTCIRQKLLHLDLHPGNVGFRVNDDGTWNVILYDMGQALDVRDSTEPLFHNVSAYYLNGRVQELFLEMTKEHEHSMIKQMVPPGMLRGDTNVKQTEMGMTRVLTNKVMVRDETMLWICLTLMKCNTLTYIAKHVRDAFADTIPDTDITESEEVAIHLLFPDGVVGEGLVVDFTEHFRLCE
jgi:predicted unusual protein kinase regulating ubiquinone biosynthesis (AarF/ABC1/UbiB family)